MGYILQVENSSDIEGFFRYKRPKLKKYNRMDVKGFKNGHIIKKESSEMEKETIKLENEFGSKELEVTQITCELIIKSEKEETFEIQKEKIEGKNEVTQITDGFSEDEYGQYINTDAAATVLESFSVAKFDSTAIKFEGTSEGILKIQEMQNDADDNKYIVVEDCEPLIIKSENANTENISGSTENSHDVTETWIKCEAVDEMKLENDLNAEACTDISYIIKNEKDKFHVCIHCNATFCKKISLDVHTFKEHPDLVASVCGKLHLCAHCAYGTTMKEHLVNHMLKHSGAKGCESNMCIHCNKTFKNRKSLDGHIIKKHSEYKHPGAKDRCKPKMCIHCSAKFKCKASLDDHLIKKHRKDISSVTSRILECQYCIFQTTSRSNLGRHVVKHPEAEGGCQLKKCIHCNRTFSNKISLDDHIVGNHPGYITTVSSKIHECIYCAYKTTFKGNLARHMLKHPEYTSEVSIKMYECAHCTYKTAFKAKLVRHMLQHSGAEGYEPNVCIHCNRTFKCRNSLDGHIIKKHSENISSVPSMAKHPGAIDGREPKTCIHCSAKFKSKASLDDHLIKKHPEDISSVTSIIHECKYCIFKTTSRSNLRRHVGKHPGAEGACQRKMCIHCNRTFSNKISLDDHILGNHPGYITTVSSKVHECIYCVYKTAFKGNLARHMLKHPDFTSGVSRKMHGCAHCTYKTAFKANLVTHMFKHSGAKRSYNLKKCIHCKATFKAKVLLYNHMIKEHPDSIASVPSKLHECTHCTYKTYFKSTLARHMLKHPDAKSSYKLNACIHCNTTFVNKINLNDHVIKTHPEHIASVLSKIHECKYCAFKTTSKGYLSKHMRKHPGAPGYAPKTCIHCNAIFKSKRSLDSHTIKNHPEHISSISSKIYECTHCTYKTTVKRNFDCHLSKMHMGTHPGAKSYALKTCIHCKTTFKSKRSLDSHTIKNHPEHISSISSKLHECTHCAYKTTVKRNFDSHSSKMHMGKHPASN